MDATGSADEQPRLRLRSRPRSGNDRPTGRQHSHDRRDSTAQSATFDEARPSSRGSHRMPAPRISAPRSASRPPRSEVPSLRISAPRSASRPPPKDQQVTRFSTPRSQSPKRSVRATDEAQRPRSRSPRRATHGGSSGSREVTKINHRSSRPDSSRSLALFLMGLPGAGKSTVKRDRMRQERFVNVEPDQLKRFHPRFSEDMDEETDTEVHRWSVRRAVDAFEDALKPSSRQANVLFDSSGSNSKWLAARIESAKEAGFRTELLWVDVPVEIALFRNRDRAVRGRWCPESVILDKAKVMMESFEVLRGLVDKAERFQNWDSRGRELEKAKEDVYLYPAPRTHPTSLRPGDCGYGEAPHGARSPSRGRNSRRTIRIGPWKRNDKVMEKKNARLDWIDKTYGGNRERFVLEEVLVGRDVLLEKNMFPYFLPPGMEHWTIWNRKTMKHNELCKYIENWLDAREPHNVISWNYDDNRGMRTIDIWHVHIYFRGADGQLPKFCLRSRQGDASGKMLRTNSVRSPCSV